MRGAPARVSKKETDAFLNMFLDAQVQSSCADVGSRLPALIRPTFYLILIFHGAALFTFYVMFTQWLFI